MNDKSSTIMPMVPLKLTPEGAVSSTWVDFMESLDINMRARFGEYGAFVADRKHHEPRSIKVPVRQGINDATWVKTMTAFASTAPTRAEDTTDEVWTDALTAYLAATPQRPDGDTDDEWTMKLALCTDRMKNTVRKQDQWTNTDQVTAFQIIRSNVSEDIWNKVKRLEKIQTAAGVDFDELMRGGDPVQLLDVLENIVCHGETGGVTDTDRLNVERSFESFTMTAGMSLVTFDTTWMQLLKMCEMAGVKRNWTDKELALKYLYKLGPAYSGLLLNLNAQQNMGNDYFPKTVRLAQSMAARHLVQADVKKAPIFTAELNEVDEYVLVTLPSGEPSLVKNPKYKRTKKDSKAKSGSKKKTIKFPEGLKETQVNDPKYSKMKCFETDCGGPHPKHDCVVHKFKKEQLELPENSGLQLEFMMYTFHGSLAERQSNVLPCREGDEDEECFSMLCGVGPKPPIARKQSNDEWYALPCGSDPIRIFPQSTEERAELYAEFKRLGPDVFGIDSMAGASVTANSAYSDLWERNGAMELIGVGGKRRTEECGKLLGGDGLILWKVPSDSGVPNILCLADVIDKCQGKFHNDLNLFTAVIGGRLFQFPRVGKIYCGSLAALREQSGPVYPIATACARRQAYTTEQVRQANMASELVTTMGGIGYQDLTDMVSHGDILNLDITAAAIQRARDIDGEHLTHVRGATKRRAQRSVPMLDPLDVDVQQRIAIWVDIMFVDGMPALISVAGTLKTLQVHWLTARSYSFVRAALLKQLSVLRQAGFQVTELHTDGEGAIYKYMKRDLPEGVIFNARTKNQHVSEIEAAIRVVKERTRGVKNILPYTLAPLLLMWLVAYVTTMLNWVPVKTLSERVSSNVVMFGRKCNAETDLSLQFGQYVETHDHDMITNTLKSRTTPSIALMPVGNLQGSWWFLPLVEPLGSAKPVRRDRWTEIPMPDSALAALNAWALNSGGGKVDFSFTLDGREIELEQVELDDRHEKHERADGPVRVAPGAEQTPDAVELFSDVPIPGIDEPTPEGRLGEGRLSSKVQL